ncbi:WXG100 family type VII secretion target [Streptomyces sp. NPDC048644]|uniref:WXG100 family type VII secretion target n=1 Tax=Streptomyces sp. NPDC048644 TaxID=3365582 RepID=UPI003711FE1F
MSPGTDPTPETPVVYGQVGGVHAKITVDGELLRTYGEQIGGPDGGGGYVEDLGSQVSRLFKALGALQLGWAGQTQEEAESFFRRLDACMTSLFGKTGDEQSQANSVLARVAFSLTLAGNNYLSAEDAISKEFGDFASQLLSWGGGGDGKKENATDANKTAIGEIF